MLRFTFCIDGMLLLSVTGKTLDKQYEFLAELIEMLGVQKEELKYLSQVVVSILEQDSGEYESAKTMMPCSLGELNLYFYIKDYYIGAIIDNNEEKHYFANKLSRFTTLDGKKGVTFKQKKVVFENLIISLNCNWGFEGCKEVIFKNCQISGADYSLIFESIGKLIFEKCTISGFKDRIGYMNSINEFSLLNNKVIECGYTCDGDERGGVWVLSGSNWKAIEIKGNEFINCYIKARTYRNNYGVTGVIMSVSYGNYLYPENMSVINNKFIGSDCINNGNYTAAQFSRINPGNRKVEGNECTGKLQVLFE
jgi:hypothetical protein